MGVMFLIAFFLVSFLIVGLVLLQEGKGGGLTGMSAGMDGVMGARNPLRRLTAYLFVIFILMAISINVYFHNRTDNSLPEGAVLPEPVRTLQEDAPAPGVEVVPEGTLRPDSEPEAGTPLRPDEAPAAPVMSIRPEPAEAASIRPEAEAAAPVAPLAPPDSTAEEVRRIDSQLEKIDSEIQQIDQEVKEASEAASALRPETPAEAEATLQPPAEEAAGSLVPPAPETASESLTPPEGETKE